MVFLLLVVPRVLGEVPGGCDGPEGEDGLGGVQAPPGAGDIHSILDEVPAGPFDAPGGDRPASGQGSGVVQVGRLVGQVGRRLQSRFPLGCSEFRVTDTGTDPNGLALSDQQRAVALEAVDL